MIFEIYLPVRNEEIDLENTIKTIKNLTTDKIIVIDNNSSDNSKEIAKKNNVEVWNENKIGKANVIKKIIKESRADIIFFTDSDNTYSFTEYNNHKEILKKNDYDMIIGKRNYEIKFLKRIDRKIANIIFNFIFKLLIGGNFSDICSGYRFLKREKFNNIQITSKNFEIETELSIFSIKNKLRYKELPINYRERVLSVSKLKTFKDGFGILFYLIKHSFKK